MMSTPRRFARSPRCAAKLLAACSLPAAGLFWSAAPAYGQRVFGVDTSSAANASSPTQTMWNNAFNDADGDGVAYKFAIVRSSRGGTADATRLDDGHFYDNITRSTTAGMLAGSYHYARADVTTHTAADDANHYLERAGMYMKPGYIIPVFDLEAGNTQNTTAQLTTWSLDFINTIFATKGINPIVYTNSSYNNDEVTPAVAFTNIASLPHTGERTYQWVARPSGNLQTGEPGAAALYPNPYGGWDPNFNTRTNSRDPAINPWVFWQNGSGSPNGFLVDYNAANGNIELVKDFLVPALWTTGASGDWATLSNWNSDNPGYVAGNTATGPAPRLPNSLDTVNLNNWSGSGYTVTISTGAQSVRKLVTSQALNITGGSLTVGYVPGSGGKWDVPSEFAAAVTISGSAGYTAHTTQVDGGGGQFNINGGTVTFRDIQLASHASNSGKIVMGGDATFAPYGGSGTSTIRSTGSLAQAGSVSLGAANRTFTVNNGSAVVDLSIQAVVSGSGGLIKAGAGTLQLAGTNTYSGGTTVNTGTLRITNDANLGAAPGVAQANNIVLNGGTIQSGTEINTLTLTNAGSGYTSFPTLTINGAGADGVTPSANVLAGLSTISVTAGGSNYVNGSSTPTPGGAGTFVDIVGGGGTGAAAFATVVSGVVTGITITNAGTGYTSMPTIHISSTINAGNLAGSGAAAQVSAITLQSLKLNDAGFDYTSPTVTLTGGGGTGATGSATSTPNWTLAANRGIQLGASGGTLYQTGGTTLTYAGVISGTSGGALNKSGAGTLLLGGNSTYNGATNVLAGTLQTAIANALPSTTQLVLSSGTTFNMNGFSQSILTLTGSGNTSLGSGTLSVTFSGGSATYSGAISGGGGLTKAGTGTMHLTGAGNSFTGPLTINGGTIAAGNDNLLGNATLATLTLGGGTLRATGAITTLRPLTFAAGGGTIDSNGSAVIFQGTGATAWTGAAFINGAGSVSISRTGGAVAVTPGASVTVNPGATLNLGGSVDGLSDGVDHVDVINNSTTSLVVTSGAKNLGALSGVGNTTVNSGAQLTATSIRQNVLTINGAAAVRANGTSTGTSRVTSLSVGGSSSLDLADNKMIVTGMTRPAVEALVQTGRNGGNWLGNGIRTSLAVDTLTTLAVAANSDLLKSTFGGLSVATSDVLVMYTYTGDADLSGFIDGDDFFAIDAGYASTGSGYAKGDFNYDGAIDADDYFLIDTNYHKQGSPFAAAPPAGVQSVPEPAGAALIALAAGLLARRRRR